MMIQIYNPNIPKRKRKRSKLSEFPPRFPEWNMPVAHTTINGRGHIGRLLKKRNRK